MLDSFVNEITGNLLGLLSVTSLENTNLLQITMLFLLSFISTITSVILSRLQRHFLSSKKTLIRPSGHLFTIILGFLFTKQAFNKHFAQIFADMRDEVSELDAQGHTWKRRWIVLVYHLALFGAVVSFFAVSILKRFASIWKLL